MQTSVVNLTNVPIVDAETHRKVGSISQTFLDPDRGMIVAFAVKVNSILPKVEFLALSDIESFETHALVASGNCIVPLSEMPRIQDIIKDNRPIIGQRAISTSKTHLGRVVDATADTLTGQIINLEVHHLLRQRLFSYQDVDEVTQDAVIFRRDLADVPKETVIEEKTSTPEVSTA